MAFARSTISKCARVRAAIKIPSRLERLKVLEMEFELDQSRRKMAALEAKFKYLTARFSFHSVACYIGLLTAKVFDVLLQLCLRLTSPVDMDGNWRY